MSDTRNGESPGGRLPDGPHEPGRKLPSDPPPPRPGDITIRIDRKEYRVPHNLLDDGKMTGAQIRRLADPDIGEDRDLFEVVPGGSDRKIGDGDEVVIRNGLRFFSAPAQINPGLGSRADPSPVSSSGPRARSDGGKIHVAD